MSSRRPTARRTTFSCSGANCSRDDQEPARRFERSTDLFVQAIAEDPGYGEPYAGLAMWQNLNWQNHWTDDWRQSLEKAERYLDLALENSPQVAFVHYVAAVFYLWKKDLDRSAAEADAALNLNPNYALAHNSRGIVNIYGGEPLAAVPHIKHAMRLDPCPAPIRSLSGFGLSGRRQVRRRRGAVQGAHPAHAEDRPLARLSRRRARPSGRGGGSQAGLGAN